jgi:hypothetical protein
LPDDDSDGGRRKGAWRGMRGGEAVAARCSPAAVAREQVGRGRYMEYVRTLYINVVVHSKN